MEHKLQFLVLLDLCSKLVSIEIKGFYQFQSPLWFMEVEDQDFQILFSNQQFIITQV